MGKKINKNSTNVTRSGASADKGACHQPDNLNLVPRPHMVENQSPLIVCPLHTMCAPAKTKDIKI